MMMSGDKTIWLVVCKSKCDSVVTAKFASGDTRSYGPGAGGNPLTCARARAVPGDRLRGARL